MSELGEWREDAELWVESDDPIGGSLAGGRILALLNELESAQRACAAVDRSVERMADRFAEVWDEGYLSGALVQRIARPKANPYR